MRTAARGHRGLALAWIERGHPTRALESLRQAVALDPTYLDAILDLGTLLHETGHNEELMQVCRRALHRHPAVPELHKLLIDSIATLGSLDDADAVYRLARRDSGVVDPESDKVLCCFTVRDERVRLPFFLEYYRDLGVDRFLAVDNDSSDGTAELLLDQDDVLLWSSDLPFVRANFGASWFELMLRRHGTGKWCVLVDADEFLYFDGIPDRTLHHLCSDLDARGMRAATGVLLDRYSDRPIADVTYREGDDPLALCPFFDRKFCDRRMGKGGQYANQTVFWGGVRQRVFPTENDYLLSKAVLLRYDDDVVLTSGQHLTNIPHHEITHEEICVFHVKFLATIVERAEVESGRAMHANAAEQYHAYHRRFADEADLTLYDPAHSVRFEGASQLRRFGILAPQDAS